MLDNASLAARRERIVELYFDLKSEALLPRIVTIIEFESVKAKSASSQTKLAASAS